MAGLTKCESPFYKQGGRWGFESVASGGVFALIYRSHDDSKVSIGPLLIGTKAKKNGYPLFKQNCLLSTNGINTVAALIKSSLDFFK